MFVDCLRRTFAAEASAQAAQEAERLEQDRKNILEQVAMNEPLDRIAQTIADAIARHAALACCSIQIAWPGTGRISVSRRLPEPLASLLAQAPLASVRATVCTLPVEELSDDPQWQRRVTGTTGIPQLGYLAVPVCRNGVIAGMVISLRPPDQPAANADKEILESAARFASLAIERRGLYEQLSFRAQHDELTLLLNRAALYEQLDVPGQTEAPFRVVAQDRLTAPSLSESHRGCAQSAQARLEAVAG